MNNLNDNTDRLIQEKVYLKRKAAQLQLTVKLLCELYSVEYNETKDYSWITNELLAKEMQEIQKECDEYVKKVLG